MQCQHTRQKIDSYLANQLCDLENKHIENHLATCPGCQDLLLVEDPELDELLGTDWYAVTPSADFAASVMNRLPKQQLSWAKVGVIALAWSGYIAGWLAFLCLLLFPSQSVNLIVNLATILVWAKPLVTAVGTIFSSLLMLELSPLGLILLFLVTTIIMYSLTRLDKEDLA